MAEASEATGQKAKRKWLPIVSEPAVFTRYAAALGCENMAPSEGAPGVSFCDVFGLDPDLLGMVPRPVLAVVLLYPIEREEDAQAAARRAMPTAGSGDAPFYMRQKIGNACGTIALLHSIANNLDFCQLKEGSFLHDFVSACADMSPEERADYLDRVAESGLEAAHHTAAVTDEGNGAVTEDDMNTNLHFVCYVHRGGTLWELDGRKAVAGPVPSGACSGVDLLERASEAIQRRMAASSSIRFNIMALTLAT